MRLKSTGTWILILVFLIFLAPATTPAQVSEKEKAQKELEQKEELKRRTLNVLDEVTSGAWGLKLPENRSFIQATAADLLWTHDEKRARSLFWEALNSLSLTSQAASEETIKDAATKGTTSKGQTKGQAKSQREYFETLAARSDLLRNVARHDPQLALDMLRATRQAPPEQVDASFRLPDDNDLEQSIANEAAERDPKKALQIARETLAKGLTFELMHLVQRLNQKNQEAGTEFASDIIDKLQTMNLATDLHAWWLAETLLVISRTPMARAEGEPTPNSTWRHLKLSDEQKQKLVELLTDVALSASVNPNVLHSVTEFMPEIEQFAPDRAARLKTKIAQSSLTLNKNQKDWNTYSSLFRGGTPEEMIRAGATVGEDQRQALYSQAVVFAVLRNRANALRDFIGTEVDDDSRRKMLLDALDAEQIGAAVYQGKADELRKLLPLIRLKEQRARAMAELAMLLEKKGEHEDALELLAEAHTLVKVDLRSETQSQALMTFLLAYALVDPPKAFTIVEPIIDRTNDNVSKLLLLDKIAKSGAVKSGEIVLNHPGTPLDFTMFKYGPGVVALAKADYTRAKSLADRFQRNELRLLARLMFAHAVLRSLNAPTDKSQPAAANLP